MRRCLLSKGKVQRPRLLTERFRTDGRRHSLERMGDALGFRRFAIGELPADYRAIVGVVGHEHAQETEIEQAIAAGRLPACLGVQADDSRQCRPRAVEPGRLVVGAPVGEGNGSRQPAQEHFMEPGRIHRLAEVIVHSCGQAALAILVEGVGGDRDNRQRAAAR